MGDRPLVDHAVRLLLAAGARDLSFNAFHLPDQMQRYVSSLASDAASLRCVVESELLGTAGGLRGLYVDHDHVLVWNGDIYAPDLDVSALLFFGRQEWPVLVVAPTAGHAGTLGLNRDASVARLRHYRFGHETAAADYVGIGVFPRAFIETLPRQGCLVEDGLIPWLTQGNPVSTFTHGGYWSDGGTVRQYLAQHRHWLEHGRRERNRGEHSAEAHWEPGAVCEPTVRVTHSVVGGGARVLGHGELAGCVVWPGAVATAPLRDAVVLPSGIVVRPEGEGNS